MVRQLSHETRWPLNPKDLLRGRVWSDAGLLLARLRATQLNGCVPAARQSLHEATQGSAGQSLGTPRWSGNPTPSRRHCQHHPQHCWPAQLPHALDPRRGVGHCDDEFQHSILDRHRSILVRHRLLTHRTV